MNKICLVFIFLLLSACSTDKALVDQISNKLSAEKMPVIDLSKIGSASWQRLCLLKPYTTNEHANKILGFSWNAESQTSISSNDTVTVLLFINAVTVEDYIEYPRNKGDFTTLTPDCLPRNKAQVKVNKENGWTTITAIS